MAGSLTDKITDTRNGGRPNSARATGIRASGGSSLACDNLIGWPLGSVSKVHFVTYKIDANSKVIAGSQLDCSGLVSGNTINSFTVLDGTDTGNSVGDVVEMLPTASWGQDLSDALELQHTRTGAHKNITTDTIATTGNATIGGNETVAGTLGVTGVASFTAVPLLPDNTVTPEDLISGAGTSWPWQSWTPTWANLTVGNGINAFKYVQIGKTVYFRGSFTLGSTSAVGTNPTFTLPVTSVSLDADSPLGTGTMVDASAGVVQGVVTWKSTTTASPTYTSTTYYTGLTATAPYTWTTSDKILVSGFYEAA